MKIRKTELLIYIVSAELVGAVSAILAGGFSEFFAKFKEPPLLPPEWLFPVVWVILYAVMGISAYLIHTAFEVGYQKNYALGVYWVQLFFNFLWSIIFFRFEMLWVAFAEILLLLLSIILMMIKFYKISKTAALINIPYLIWVAFAAYLNFATAYIN